MKNLLIVGLALCSSLAFARPNTANMSCRDATGMIAANGAIVMSHGNANLYQRFVANRSFCGSGEQAVAAYVTTMDNNNCKIGYVCDGVSERGGSSVSKKFPSTIGTCKAGTVGFANVTDYYPNTYVDSERAEPQIKVVCNASGKFVPANDLGWTIPKTVGGKCKDGATYTESDHSGEKRSDAKTTTFVCSAGKWYKK